MSILGNLLIDLNENKLIQILEFISSKGVLILVFLGFNFTFSFSSFEAPRKTFNGLLKLKFLIFVTFLSKYRQLIIFFRFLWFYPFENS